MAIFSSSKRKKETATASNSGQSSPPLNGQALPRSQSGTSVGGGGAPPGAGGRYEAPPSGIPVSASSSLLQQSAPGSLQQGAYAGQAPGGQLSSSLPPSLASSRERDNTKSPPPASSSLSANLPPATAQAPPPQHMVHYPWSTRPLVYGPHSVFNPKWSAAHGVTSTTPQFLDVTPGQQRASPEAFPRYGHSVNPTASLPNGDLYVFGGLVAQSVKNDLFVISAGGSGDRAAAAGAITTAAAGGPAPAGLGIRLVETQGEVPGPRVGHASVGVGNVLIVWGGDTKSSPEDKQDDSLYLLNLTTGDWTRVKTSGPAPEGRYGHAAAMVGSRFFIFGGQKDDGGFMNDLVWFDLQKLKAGSPRWTFVDYPPKAVVPPQRTGHTAVTYGDCIYIFGGTDGQYHYNDTWCYDTNTQQWTELSCIGYIPVPREGHAATLVDDVMYIFGGRGVDGKDLEDLAAFKIGNQRWFMFQNMGPAPSGRSGHAMATYQNKVFVLGGESYTSLRADNPAFVHVLDTGKIKYPQDNSRTGNSRKSSVLNTPQNLSSAAAPPPVSTAGSIPALAALANKPNGSTHPGIDERVDERERDRSVSPTNRGMAPNGALQPSVSQMLDQQSGMQQPPTSPTRGSSKPGILQQQQQQQPSPTQPSSQGSKIAKRVTTGGAISPPPRPPRPGDEQSLLGGLQGAGSAVGPDARRSLVETGPSSSGAERSLSPVGSLGGGAGTEPRRGDVSPTAASGASSLTATPQAQAPAQLGGPASTGPRPRQAPGAGSPQLGVGASSGNTWSQVAHQQHDAEAPRQGNSTRQTSPSPQDGFYYPSATGSNVRPNGLVVGQSDRKVGEEVAALKAREKWFQAALGLASKQGFVPPPREEGLGIEGLGETDGGDAKIVQALVQMKQELSKARSVLADQAHSVDERFAAASRARNAALQEASYYRAKLAALEAGSVNEANRLERERLKDLEHRLSEALAAKTSLEHQVEKLSGDLDHHTEMRSSVEERHTAALNRADAAESSYSRALTDYADLQRRAQSHEQMATDQLAELASLKSRLQVLEAEKQAYLDRAETSETAVGQHTRVIEETQVALAAAHARNDETHSMWQSTQTELSQHRERATQLEAEVTAKQAEVVAANNKAADFERLLNSTREEHNATKLLATGGLATLLEHHRSAKRRSVPDEEHAGRLRAVEEEGNTLRQLHQDARARADSTLAELQEARAREVALQTQVVQMRSEIASLHAQHAASLDEARRHKSVATDRDGEMREAHRQREAAEVKVSLLRNIMADHGLATSDEDLAARFPPMSGNETPEQLHRRVQDLELRLEQRTRAHAELEAAHEDARRELQDTETRFRDASTQHQAAEAQLQSLRSAPSAPEDGLRAAKAEEELTALQTRHQQLEQTHTRAIAYVKGTEKMLRRMKEELTRYKERNEELEAEAGERGVQGDLRKELDSLRVQLRDVGANSARSAKENEELHQRLGSLQTDFERQLHAHRTDADKKVRELEAELTSLDQELEKARQDLGESLAVNQDLQQALKAAGGGGASQSRGGDPKRLEQDLVAAQSKVDWLKRENAALEKRCETAEQKIHILLDHMEGASGDMSPDGGNSGFDHRRAASDAGSDYSQNERQTHR